jgi:hypothetical protein
MIDFEWVRDAHVAHAAYAAHRIKREGFLHSCANGDSWKPPRKIKMAGNSAEATSDINIDAKRASAAIVREALFQATGEEKWRVNDEWAYFLVRKVLYSSFIILTQDY